MGVSDNDDDLRQTIHTQITAVNGLAGRVDELTTAVELVRSKVNDNYEQFASFATASRNDRQILNERLRKVEVDGITRETMTEAMRLALQKENVVTKDTLVKMGVTEFAGGAKRFLAWFVVTGAGLGGCVVLIQHIVGWLH